MDGQKQLQCFKTDTAHTASKAFRYWMQASRGCRLLTACKSDADRKRAFSSLGCLLFQHPDAHGEERNPSNPFLEARCTAEEQQQKYRALKVCLPRAERTMQFTLHFKKPVSKQL